MIGAVRILGLDPGLQRTGYGVIDVKGSHLVHVAHGVVTSDRALPLAQRLLQLHVAITQIILDLRPEEAAVEQTFVSKDAVATLKLGQARAIALLVPAQHGLAVAEYAPNMVKKSVVGVGHAEKEQVQAMIRILLPKCVLKSADAADALAVAITHAHHAPQRLHPGMSVS
ncbi:MAG: crossover junction endodeoxyribonuclease RuvC [Alphaproteobacteria bacterium]|nr:crossover junction endodeoxyribonuclease RuvC [Alphaproteobacteria bacterium]